MRSSNVQVALGGSAPSEAASIGEVLRILGAGPCGSIVMGLGSRPLRTAERMPNAAPRTVYRHLQKLAALGMVEREESDGAPSAVLHRLSPKTGRELFRLLNSYATAALPRGPEGRTEDGAWTTVGLLGEMWEAGWIEELSRTARSPTELAELTDGLTFHQAKRRVRLMSAHGLLRRSVVRERGTRYQLDRLGRQGVGLIAGVASWRQRYLLPPGSAGLTVSEMATILRASLPLLEVPKHPATTMKLGLVGATDGNGGRGAGAVIVRVGPNGALCPQQDDIDSPDGWALGTVDTWLAAVLDGKRERLRMGGDLALVESGLRQLHTALWAPANEPVRVA